MCLLSLGRRVNHWHLVMSPLYRLLLGTLCTWRITHLFHAEDGPWDVIVRIPGDRRWFLGKFAGLLLLPELVGFPAAGVDPGADDHGKGIVVAGAFRWRDLTGESYLGMRRQG